MTTDTASRLSKSETVYRELRQRITAGRYNAGFRLVLDQIAREFGVSPVPVREALRRLEAERLVTFTRNVGAEVAAVDLDDYADAMQVLALLEGAATATSAPLLTPAQVGEAEAINRRMRALADSPGFDPREFSDLNQQFHVVLCQCCPNEHLARLWAEVGERVTLIRRNVFPFEPVRSTTSVDEHDGILALIKAGAPASEIEASARKHKLRTVRQFVENPPVGTRA